MRLAGSVCGDLDALERREWLVTNGRGGYAMGTLAGTLTRRYHGLLVAAVDPPAVRRLVVARLDLEVVYDGTRYALATNRWASGAIEPEGWRFITAFALEDGLPRWDFDAGDARLTLTVAMPYGADATALMLQVERARVPLRVHARLIAADRDHHGGALPSLDAFPVRVENGAATVALPESQRTLHVFAPGAAMTPANERYAGYALPLETERGLPDREDYAHVLDLTWERLECGAAAQVVVSLDPAVEPHAQAVVDARRARNRALADAQASPLLGTLALAGDAFVVGRANGGTAGTTVIAGYPWFTDWGRDTMIALPGLFLATGRHAEAADVLRTFAAYVSDGLIPNRFPDAGGPAEYNTIDASLWYVEAVRAYVAQTGDEVLLRDVFEAVRAIVDGYRHGTRFGIGVDDADGLVYGGADGVQLTWMDAKVGDWVVTPRRGKAVEICALWYNALRACEEFAQRLGGDGAEYAALAAKTRAGMARFWDASRGFCCDVLDGPHGDDATLRPNQLLAVSLAATAFEGAEARAIVDVCAARLWTPLGLRTLPVDAPDYVGRYDGPQTARDAAYHRGTVWPWLMGPFVRAHLRAYDDPAAARAYAAPLLDALDRDALGTLCEIADGDAPHTPRGCPAQAWSVAELTSLVAELG